jgi:hypothetical protein
MRLGELLEQAREIREQREGAQTELEAEGLAELEAERQQRRRLEATLERIPGLLEQVREMREEREDLQAELEAERHQRRRMEATLERLR